MLPAGVKRFGQGLARLGRRVGQFQAALILTLFYFIVLAPVALVFKILADPLRLRNADRSSWHRRDLVRDLQAWAKAQF